MLTSLALIFLLPPLRSPKMLRWRTKTSFLLSLSFPSFCWEAVFHAIWFLVACMAVLLSSVVHSKHPSSSLRICRHCSWRCRHKAKHQPHQCILRGIRSNIFWSFRCWFPISWWELSSFLLCLPSPSPSVLRLSHQLFSLLRDWSIRQRGSFPVSFLSAPSKYASQLSSWTAPWTYL